jgi:hypothetical protein
MLELHNFFLVNFGKDLTQLLHRYIWQSKLSDCNRQYHTLFSFITVYSKERDNNGQILEKIPRQILCFETNSHRNFHCFDHPKDKRIYVHFGSELERRIYLTMKYRKNKIAGKLFVNIPMITDWRKVNSCNDSPQFRAYCKTCEGNAVNFFNDEDLFDEGENYWN